MSSAEAKHAKTLAKHFQTCLSNMFAKHDKHGCWQTCLAFEISPQYYANSNVWRAYGKHSGERVSERVYSLSPFFCPSAQKVVLFGKYPAGNEIWKFFWESLTFSADMRDKRRETVDSLAYSLAGMHPIDL
jgi:hypothetical protein